MIINNASVRFGIDLGKIMINCLIDICQILKNGIIIQRKSIGHTMMEVTKTNKKIGLILVSVLAFSAVSGGIILTTYAFNDQGCRPFKQPFFGDLTDEQKEEMMTMMDELRDNGATREEIREAVTARLTEWGIEVPEFEGPRLPPWTSDLTDEQKEEMMTMMDELRDNGATREEIREAVTARLTEWGIEVPEDNPHPMPRWLQNLTEEQKTELQNLMDELKEKGASHEEIRAEIDAKLQQWGIEIPEQPMPPPQ
jgi:DNA-binding transcriptional MerR regulator